MARVRLAPSLWLDSASAEEIGDDDPMVVDFYVRRGRGLRLHELASLALCRALDMAPFLLKSVLSYFEFCPPPFQRSLSVDFTSEFTEKDVIYLLCGIRVTYRFLLLESTIFKLWDWSCFLNLVEQNAHSESGDSTVILISLLDIRWCVIQILSVVLKISDRATGNFDMGMDEAFLCLLRWESFCQDTSVEKLGWYLQKSELDRGGCLGGTVNIGHCLESFDHGSLAISCPDKDDVSKRRKRGAKVSCYARLSGNPFILTSTMKKSFEIAVMAVSQKWPILLHGPTGSGKTALINYLAQLSRNQVLFIHMDEQTDSKTLVGTYICTEIPGEFKWQPGSLTQAILEGFWVVFEGIDKAPNEVQSVILPLLEGSTLFGTGHGEVINVPECFRLFATVSTTKHEGSYNAEGRLLSSALWRKVMVRSPSREDLSTIINAWYPSLKTFSMRLVETFEHVNSLAYFHMSGFSRFSLRDLLKWAKRVSGLDLDLSRPELTAVSSEKIYQEAIDVFAASTSSLDKRFATMSDEVAKMWGVVSPAPNKPLIQNLKSDIRVGRITLQRTHAEDFLDKRPFVGIRSALVALERVACSIKYNEPVLLVGETGTGKTTLVQFLSMRLGQPLRVMNLSQQSDVADLLGGYKPTDARSVCMPLYHQFKKLLRKTVPEKGNAVFLGHLENFATLKKWENLLQLIQSAVNSVQSGKIGKLVCGSKRTRPLSEKVHDDWKSFSSRLHNAHKQISGSASMSFKFVEGAFITALKCGHWILLDEVNLAPPELLHRIVSVLDGETGTVCLTERGDVYDVNRHPSFRLFACMNPATDAGKRELPYSFRSRVTEVFIDDVRDAEDLSLFVKHYMDGLNAPRELSQKIVEFYIEAKKASEESLQDGANQKPQFSLRSLARAVEYTKIAVTNFGLKKALYDGFCMFFLTSLDCPSATIMKNMIVSKLLDRCLPPDVPFNHYLKLSGRGSDSAAFVENYILTGSVKEHLKNLARAVFIKRYPVLLQGPTSSGKTSLVQYLASVTGNEFVRINNHEHTDLQEYFGSYITDSTGGLVFQEGVLVSAVRKGHWIVLDELNLAPSDVLEALNRLLDDNRELFVPELQEAVSAHPDFMLFATQNPPTLYGGRKMLSRAFRNRFLEIHVDEIPENELTTIIEKRCNIPASRAMKMVEVMKDLQLHRQNSKIFAGKHGFITPRDLFRWAIRYRTFGISLGDLARDGYLLLGDRLREENENTIVKETLERRLRVELRMDDLYKEVSGQDEADLEFARQSSFPNIIWTKSMQRLYFLVKRCYILREPVLLVGETGGGKTTVCQLLSAVLKTPLHILNCHQYTETSDFLGGYRPLREKSTLATEFQNCIESLKKSTYFLHFPKDLVLSSDISRAPTTLDQLNIYKPGNISQQDVDAFEKVKLELMHLHQKWQTIFLWQDGPLVQAMKKGHLFLVDEISLADDSVLERLNSVLEPERKLLLAEKGGSDLEEITAHPSFFILATMNPSGDYGKKELSPALRNRFTEIWVPPISDSDELRCVAIKSLKPALSRFAEYMLNFWQWFKKEQTGRLLTLRDLLSWTSFINETEGSLGPAYAFVHGAFLVVLDGLSLGTGMSKTDAKRLRDRSLSFLLEELQVSESDFVVSCQSKMENYGWGDAVKHEDISFSTDDRSQKFFGFNPFYFAKGQNDCKKVGFEFLAPTTCRNAMRVLRAMQLRKPVLLEGSPGVGKTSLVVALAQHSGHSVVRINLSEQTDMMDLLGSDLPFEGDNGIEFHWSDGILLQALKYGSWVLLDELNLAPQSVLEGLNSILDHRADIFIPELGQTFKCPDSFRIFACQNPSGQGGGRKGLPKSFLNRFTKVYVDELAAEDYLSICKFHHPAIHETLLLKLISFNNSLYDDTVMNQKYGRDGSPWEFNLRDVIRSCQIIEGAPEKSKHDCFLNTVYLQRMRTPGDRIEVLKLYESVFGVKPRISQYPDLHINPRYLTVGSACVGRNHFQPMKNLKSHLSMLPGIFQCFEAAVHCVQQGWLCILVGPYSSGKTSLVRLLAQLTGNALKELNLSSGTDVSELIGCFEQYNCYRSFQNVMSQIERYVNEYFALRLELDWKDLILQKKNLFTKWFSILATRSRDPSWSTCEFDKSRKSGLCNSTEQLIEILNQLKHDLHVFQLPVSWSVNDLDRSLKTILEWQRITKIPQSAKFEWVSSDLIRAVESGEWVVLDNANLCNPTVLDRINSLVEPEGHITVNECGLVNGKPLMLHAHNNFRMFLTVDPKHGEVSRAMRNRGVEVFMMQPDWLPNGEGCRVAHGSGELFLANATGVEMSANMLNMVPVKCLAESNGIHNDERHHLVENSEVNDVKKFLILSGIPIMKLVVTMSNAHMNAKAAGSHLGIRISLLELKHWVQLFQILLMSGNHPAWSLQLSWEHTYISLLGEFERSDTIIQELSSSELFSLDTFSGCSLSLPGGWPGPHTLRNFISYSREACVKRNCVYLEFLGAQCASYELMSNTNFQLNSSMKIVPSIIPKNLIHSFLFPSCPDNQDGKSSEIAEFDFTLANKMLFIAANWAIEQSTETDLVLYIQLFKWFNSQLQPNCRFFESFLMILEQEKDHPIWNCILRCRAEMLSHKKIDVDVRPIPFLSTSLVDLIVLDGSREKCKELLCNAIYCISLLHRTLQQWSAEKDFSRSFGETNFYSVFECLRCLEREVLRKIVEYKGLSHLYSNLIDDHILLWNLTQNREGGKSITPLHLDYMSITWRRIRKSATKLQFRFPGEVHELLEQKLNLSGTMSAKLHYEKPTLWIHGGHPFLPSSSDIFHKVQQLLFLCDTVWPKKKLLKQTHGDNRITTGAAISANADLRHMVLQGVCMASYLTTKTNQDEVDIMYQLEEIYQRLSRRFEYERRTLEMNCVSETITYASLYYSTATCVFSPKMLLRQSSFDSWTVTVPLCDKSSFTLDIKLLQELSRSTSMDVTKANQVLSNMSDSLRYALEYSLNFSSRPPLDFSPHQTILWILDADSTADLAQTKIASFVLEMWYNWHSSMWNVCYVTLKKFSQSVSEGFCHLVPLTRTGALDKICHDGFSIKDYDVHCLKLKVASRNLWQDVRCSLSGDIHSSANSLFKQIIFVHRRSFKENVFEEVMSILAQMIEKGLKLEQVKDLKRCISSSSNHVLAAQLDLFTKVTEALIEEPNIKCPSCDTLYNLGCAWFYIGVLRYRLLLNSNGPDPALKFDLKHSQIQEKISSLKLEIKVRQECNNLAGRSSTSDDEEKRVSLLQNLEMEKKRVKEKVVYRPEPSKYKNLILLCANFLEFGSPMELIRKLRNNENPPGILDEACNWQVTSASFIDKLEGEYAEYLDIIRPIEVAVYEMKLGLSIALSSALEREYLKKVHEDDIQKISATIYSLIQFPKILPARFVPHEMNFIDPELMASTSCFVNINLLEKLTTTRDIALQKGVSLSVRRISLVQIAHDICVSRLMDKGTFLLLDDMFIYFARLWRDMKTKDRDGKEQYYEFRPRSVMIEDIFQGNFGTPNKLGSDGTLLFDYEEMLIEPEFTAMKQHKTEDHIENDLELIPEFILKSIVLTHKLLFRSSDVVKDTSICHIPDEEIIRSFVDSYKLGTRILNDDLFFWLPFSTLDDCLMPEHLLYACLGYKQTLDMPHKETRGHNIYKDSVAFEMFKMVKPLTIIQERVGSLLNENQDHPILQKVLDLTNMLLTLPHCTPLSKALFGLQVLVSEAKVLQESSSRFSFTDQLQPIYDLVFSWQKWGVDCWPILLDGVQEQYEVNTSELWYPLLLVLRGTNKDEVIESVVKFIETSSVGEFKRRLHLLLGFHGHLNRGICLEVYASHVKDNLNIIYNAFGYYIQFLPLVSEHIISSRRSIEKDLEESQKLFAWGLRDKYSSIDNFRRTRQKIWKLIEKFNDILQQPFMLIHNQELNGDKVPAWLEPSNDDKNTEALQFPVDLVQLGNTERFLWYDDWRNKAQTVLENICYRRVDDSHNEGFAFVVEKLLSSDFICESFRETWAKGWGSLEKLCKNTAEFAHQWKHSTKNREKSRALAVLLENLGKCGLSKHRPELDLEFGQASSFFLQPSHSVVHLLQQDSAPPCKDTKMPREENCSSKWEIANLYYFKNVAIMKQIEKIRQGFNKDLSLEQVKQATSFLYHLICTLQDHRNMVYHAYEQLKTLRQLLNRTGINYGYSLAPNQHATLKCMWQQKQLLDSLLAMSRDVRLYLGIVRNVNLSTDGIISGEIDVILPLVDKFEPIFKKYKGSLDDYLLGCSGDIATLVAPIPFVVSEEMNKLIMLNFEAINNFEMDIKSLCSAKGFTISVKDTILNRLQVLVIKGKEIKKDFECEPVAVELSTCEEDPIFIQMKTLMVDLFEKSDKLRKGLATVGEISTENITSWKELFGSYMEDLHLDHLCDGLDKTIISVSKLVNCTPNRKTEVVMHLKQLCGLLELVSTLGENILLEFLDVHKTMAESTYALAQLFSLLLSKGFGTADDSIEDDTSNRPQDASGTGMGEGEGVNDVSNQIDDEDQLHGSCETQEKPDGSEKVPSKNDEGVEMDEDFEAPTFSQSEDSGGDGTENDEADMDLESKMGENADGKQVADEKLWDKENDGELDNQDEKYESGPSVQESDTSCRELRAKDDNALAADDELGQMDADESDGFNKEEEQLDTPGDDGNTRDMEEDKGNAYEEPTEIKLDERERSSDDAGVDENQGPDIPEEAESGPADGEIEEKDEESNPTDYTDDIDDMQVDENIENEAGEDGDDASMDLDLKKEIFESNQMESYEYSAQGEASAEPQGDNMRHEMPLSNSNDMSNGITPSRCLPSDEVPVMDISMPDTRNGSLAPNQPQHDISQGESSSLQRTPANPYRNLGDAMMEWKEKVTVLDDPQEHQPQQTPDIHENEDADEYRYTSEMEKGSSQALGAATSDQTKDNIEGSKSRVDEEQIRKKSDVDRLDVLKEKSETRPLNPHQASIPKHKSDTELPDTAVSDDVSVKDFQRGDQNDSSGDTILFESSRINEDVLPPGTLKSDKELVNSMHVEESSDEENLTIKSDWRKYELSTTRLSQELAEQLRLVMEPTLASKLQGDYRTGKRINMKKVIPYIASHFRKDKIWLRRTRPNKRDYQLVIAVDDSRSMSEGQCGNVAIEALVTVCRAMSQLEVGQFAVASFGGKGNIKLLHDFDQPLTVEAGDKMISRLLFDQESTIGNQPVAGLLRYLNTMLDTAVARARTPSGQNPLNQLILIIADGKFHENKEELKRCVRDALNRKRMIAFILLDNPEEPIMEYMQVFREGQTLSFEKYLDSFPFPFYIILKNIEALPRTLADLLRQWFELMQGRNE